MILFNQFTLRKKQRLPSALRNWLQDTVERGSNWELKRSIQPSEETLAALELAEKDFEEFYMVPENFEQDIMISEISGEVT